jgi:hypothetical protein
MPSIEFLALFFERVRAASEGMSSLSRPRWNGHAGASLRRGGDAVVADDTHDDTYRTGHGGKASSWLAVTVILLGFTIGGVALCLWPNWFLFWMGATVFALGGVLLVTFRVFQDVTLDAPRAPYSQTGGSILN